ncbi:SH3 domain-containing protein [Polaromonas sp. YR568]|uniref:SH3 domain-containing protein n=1 Tax=Polaromonas sp. YR568 TaxID=1855301 RepID=UPI00398C0379
MILSKSNMQAGVVIPLLLAALLAFGAAAQAQPQGEAVLIKRAAQLRDGPGDTARSLAPLPVQTSVTRLGERQGAWIKVRTADGTSGWVHMFDITSASAPSGGAGTGALRSLSSFFNKGSAQTPSSTVSTSTVGIRGLGAEDLANAQPNLAAVAQADANRVNAAQARQFAGGASLSSRQVEPLPVPAPPPAAPGAAGPDQYSR